MIRSWPKRSILGDLRSGSTSIQNLNRLMKSCMHCLSDSLYSADRVDVYMSFNIGHAQHYLRTNEKQIKSKKEIDYLFSKAFRTLDKLCIQLGLKKL